MAELKFPVTEIDNDKFQVVVDMALYAKEAIVAACYKLTDRFFVHQQTEGDSVLISKFCIGKIGHFNKREKGNGLAHEI